MFLDSSPGSSPGSEAGPAAARPLVAVILCVLAGSLVAALVPASVRWSVLGLAAAAGAAAGAGHAHSTGAAPPALRDRGPQGFGPQGFGLQGCGRLALLAVFLLAVIRAGPATPAAPAATDPPTNHAMATAPVEGPWTVQRTGAGFEWGAVGADPTSFRIPAGLVAEGERVRVLPGSPRRVLARGPVLPPGDRPPPRRDLWADELVRVAGAVGHPSPVAGLRLELLRRAAALDGPRTRGLGRALVCGDTGGLDPALSDLFVRTGLRHLLAVSGMHVAWVALLFAAPLGWLVGRLASRRLRAAVTAGVAITCVLAYAELAGGAAPVRRAATAASLIFAAPLVALGPGRRGRRPDAATLWSLALLLECLSDREALGSLSVQLSYAATLGLLVATHPIAEVLSRFLGGFGARRGPAPGSLTVPLRVVLGRTLARAAVVAVAASCAAVLATLPIVWTRFGEWSPLGLLATPLVAPWVAALLAAGWLVTLSAGAVPEALFTRPAEGLVRLLEVLDGCPGTPIPLPERPLGTLVLASGLALCAAAARRRGPWVHGFPQLPRLATSGAALAWGLILLPWEPAPAGLELHALDVGHGSAVVLRAPGVGCWIFDAGSRDRGRVARRALAPLLSRWEVARPGVVLSHGDSDHSSALPWLVERYRPHTWAGALPAPLGERLPHTTRYLDLERGRLQLPSSPDPGTGLSLLRGRPGGDNEGSRSLVVELDGQTVLLCGDAEGEGLADLLRASLLPERCRLLLLPHHGSMSPWLGRLLEATAPAEVWISAPHTPPVAQELERRGLPWRCTASAGPLSLGLDFRAPESTFSPPLAWSSLRGPP